MTSGHEPGAAAGCDFALDDRLATASHALMRIGLCEVRLQDDVRFPWIVLIPRRAGAVEIADLSREEQGLLWVEAELAGKTVQAIGEALGRPVLKLNHGQLGNVVAQLHLHVVGRRVDDAAWPGPVWGFGEAEPYDPRALELALAAARRTHG